MGSSTLTWLLAGTLAATANPTPLATARERVDSLKYADAMKLLDQTLATPGLSRADLLEALQLEGVIRASMGKSAEAEQFFERWLVLEPGAKLPKRWGPKIQTAFFSARSWMDTHAPLTATRLPPALEKGQLVKVRLQVGEDALKLVRQATFHVQVGDAAPADQTVAAAGGAAAEAAVAPALAVKWWAELLGEHGETLLAVGSAAEPLAEKGEAPPAPLVKAVETPAPRPPAGGLTPQVHAQVEPASPPLRPLAYALGGAGVLALAGGGYFTYALSSDKSKLSGAAQDAQGRVTGLTQAQASQVVSDSKTHALLANVLFASGAALVAGGAGVFVWGALQTDGPGSGGEVGVAGRW
jgi:tetratricopeptide (TPR) repeat protein